jgi:riboflavin biosynthesis pyrimidine reductase
MTAAAQAKRLYPSPTKALTAAAAYAPFDDVPDDRPWVTLSMVSSVDGAVSVNSLSSGLGSPMDQAVFAALRARSDVLLVGAGTARAESYRPVRRAGQRLAIVSASGAFPADLPVFTDAQTVIVAPLDGPALAGTVERYGRGTVDLAAAIAGLRARHILAEGGPRLNGQLFALGLVDEICLTMSPAVVAGDASRLAFNAHEHFQHLQLVHVLHDDGFLFLRYRR